MGWYNRYKWDYFKGAIEGRIKPVAY